MRSLALVAAMALVASGCGDEPRPDPFGHGSHGSHGPHVGHAAATPAAAQSGEGGYAEVSVSPDGPVRTLSAALSLVKSGGRVIVHPGTYREHGVVVDKPVTIIGHDYPTLDGESAGQIMTVTADDVTIRGLRLTRVGTSYVDDRAAIKVSDARRCVIENN